MNNENISVLENLIQAKREKKKKEPTVQEKKQFLKAWIALASEEGFSERVECYLYDGFAFCGAEPFKVYLGVSQDRNATLMSLFTGKVYGKDMSVTFRMLTHLLALLLNENVEQNVLAPIIKRLPTTSLNKEKKRLGNAEKTIVKYFFAELNAETILLPLNTIETKSVFINDFCESMLSIVEGTKHTSGQNKKVATNIAKVEAWILDYYNSLETKAEAKALPQYNSPKTETIPSTVEKCREATDQTTENKKVIEVDSTVYFADLLGKVNEAASAIRSEIVQQKNKVDSLARALELEREKTLRANRKIGELEETISCLQQKLSMAESDEYVLKKMIEQKETSIAEKDTEIAERIKMANVLSRDRDRQADETLQRLASKIRVEYRDFMDALNIPMNCDLGENLRLQLQSVFDMLENGGMKIK